MVYLCAGRKLRGNLLDVENQTRGLPVHAEAQHTVGRTRGRVHRGSHIVRLRHGGGGCLVGINTTCGKGVGAIGRIETLKLESRGFLAPSQEVTVNTIPLSVGILILHRLGFVGAVDGISSFNGNLVVVDKLLLFCFRDAIGKGSGCSAYRCCDAHHIGMVLPLGHLILRSTSCHEQSHRPCA